MIVHDSYLVGRAFAKIVCSLAFVALGEQAKQLSKFGILRSYALGNQTEAWEGLVREVRLPGTLKHFGNRHIAALTTKSDHVIGLVSLFRGLELIDLGEVRASMPSFLSAVASAEIDAAKTSMLLPEETGPILQILLAEVESAAQEGIALGEGATA